MIIHTVRPQPFHFCSCWDKYLCDFETCVCGVCVCVFVSAGCLIEKPAAVFPPGHWSRSQCGWIKQSVQHKALYSWRFMHLFVGEDVTECNILISKLAQQTHTHTHTHTHTQAFSILKIIASGD